MHQEKTQAERDSLRDQILREQNLQVLRFTNEEIFSDIKNVLRKIEQNILLHNI